VINVHHVNCPIKLVAKIVLLGHTSNGVGVIGYLCKIATKIKNVGKTIGKNILDRS
jgi:hypothetical protein